MTRTVADVFHGLAREVDAAAALAQAGNPAEAAFYAQTDRATRKWHHYLAVYDRHLSRFRGTPVRLLEIGVHDGGSLQVWRRYLGPDAVVHGLDIDPRCAAVDDPDLVVHIGSQTDAALLGRIVGDMGGVDVVIDDGSHVWPHQVETFEALYPALSPQGLYICEDVHTSYWPEFGAGRPSSQSFVAYAKALVDRLHVWYGLDGGSDEGDEGDEGFARTTGSVSFYDSMVVIEKASRPKPFHTAVGRRTVIG